MDQFDSNSDIQERRPPIYNAEDYILGLKKFSKLTGLQLYLDSPLLETVNTPVDSHNSSHKKSSDLVTKKENKAQNPQYFVGIAKDPPPTQTHFINRIEFFTKNARIDNINSWIQNDPLPKNVET